MGSIYSCGGLLLMLVLMVKYIAGKDFCKIIEHFVKDV